MVNLDGKTVIITGASRGIGAVTARHMAQKGANVIAAARSASALETLVAEIHQTGGEAAACQVDVADYQQVDRLVKFAKSRYGSIDVLVNNAGTIDPITRLADSDPQAWAMSADINYKGVYFGLRAVIPEMLHNNPCGGTIINISSGAAVSALEGWSHYCSSKAAALSLTRCSDVEYREQGIRVIGLSPGTVATDMQVAIKASGMNPVSQLDPASHIPPDWVARAIIGLCGPAGDRFRGSDFSLRAPENRRWLGLPESG